MSAETETFDVTMTRPTERREGEEIAPTRVRCHGCGQESVWKYDVGRCHYCTAWGETVEEGEGDRGPA